MTDMKKIVYYACKQCSFFSIHCYEDCPACNDNEEYYKDHLPKGGRI